MSFAFVEPRLSLDLLDACEQELIIAIQGEDVLHFEGNAQQELPANRRELPDPVQVFVQAVRLGMFPNQLKEPWQCTAEILDRKVDLVGRRQMWRVGVSNIDVRGALVLANILQARLLDKVVIKSDLPPHASLQSIPGRAMRDYSFPPINPYSSLSVEYQPADRLSRERSVELVCKREVSEFAARIFSAMDIWATLLMLGGYPGPGMRPYQSAALAEPAFLLDPRTIQIDFPDLFLCDEECFAAAVNYAQVVHYTMCPIERVIIH